MTAGCRCKTYQTPIFDNTSTRPHLDGTIYLMPLTNCAPFIALFRKMRNFLFRGFLEHEIPYLGRRSHSFTSYDRCHNKNFTWDCGWRYIFNVALRSRPVGSQLFGTQTTEYQPNFPAYSPEHSSRHHFRAYRFSSTQESQVLNVLLSVPCENSLLTVNATRRRHAPPPGSQPQQTTISRVPRN